MIRVARPETVRPQQPVVLGLAASAAIAQVVTSRASAPLPLILVAAGLAVVWRQLDTDRTLAVPAVRWTLAGGVVLAAGGLVRCWPRPASWPPPATGSRPRWSSSSASRC